MPRSNPRTHLPKIVASGLTLALVIVAAPVLPRPASPGIRAWSLDAVPRRAMQAPETFGLVGVTWAPDGPAPDEVWVRTSLDGRRWSEWTSLQLPDDNEGPDAGSPEYRAPQATAPLWVGEGRHVQVRYDGDVPRDAKIRLVDPGPDPSSVPGSAAAAPAEPGIVTRAGWGADESMRRGRPSYGSSLKLAFVHHTATGNDYSPEESDDVVRSIYGYHVNSRGWDDIGYNFLVDRYGRIFEGRAGGTTRAVIGAHAKGFNTPSTGVAVIGSFDSASPTSASVDAVKRLLAWKLDVHHVDPKGTARVHSSGSDHYPVGQTATLPTILGHRDTGETSCPGGRLYSRLPSLRDDVRATGLPKIYDPAANRAVFTPNGDGRADDVTTTARLDGVSGWTTAVRTASGSTVRTGSGSGTSVSFGWDGRNANGILLSHGSYEVRVSASGARTARRTVLLANWPDGSLLKGSGSAIYEVRNGRLHHFRTPWEYLSARRWSEVARVPDAAISAYPTSGTPGFREGSLVKEPSGRISLVSDGTLRRIRSMRDFEAFGFKREAVWAVSASAVSGMSRGAPLSPNDTTLPNGILVKGTTSRIYWIQDTTKRHVQSMNVFRTWFRSAEVVRVADAKLALHPGGPTLGFRDGSLVTTRSDSRVWVISDGARRHIRSASTFAALRYSWDNVRTVSSADLALHPTGAAV